MPSLKGNLIICDRCGTSHFCKKIGEIATDGGYTVYDEFEPTPPEWMWEPEIGYLCPECAKTFKTFIKDFMGDKSIAPAWRLKEDGNA